MKDYSFFVICEKCNNHIKKHLGYMEHPKGVFSFMVQCDKCGYEFQHHMMTQEARMKNLQDKTIKAMNPENVINAVEQIMKEAKSDEGDEF